VARLVVRVVMVVLTGTLLYNAGIGADDATEYGLGLLDRSIAQPYERSVRRQYEFVRDELGRQVPSGTRMAILFSEPLWYQRLAEFAAISRIALVADKPQAEVGVTVVPDESASVGVRLVVERIG
jgi:hypothetical protein